ncbi:MAG: DUF5816 domain-containing protein [Halobacteriales archaeon]|nr:DUF5816 domain-containing protein [Halobacteriales archaeon]
MKAYALDDGTTVYIDLEDGLIGSKGPFHPIYRTEAGDERWGYFCSACETHDNAMDTMGRIVCNTCGNTRKPEEWDAAHE